jgi:hypothetical protein
MTARAPQQPTLRPFVVFDSLPTGCISYIIPDQRSLPLLRLVETFSRTGTYGCGPNDEMIETRCWYVGAYNRPRSNAEFRKAVESGGSNWGFVDGPFATEGRNADALAEKLIGRVLGILEPRFAEPMRQIGEVH